MQKFVNQPNTPEVRAAAAMMCERFVQGLLNRYPGYFGRLGYDVNWHNGILSINPYAKNIRTLLACTGYMMYALDCPEDAETYSCPLGNFKVIDGRAYKLEEDEQ